MKKLLLLDADVIIDLHTFDLFSELGKSYELIATDIVISEVKFFKKDGYVYPLDISQTITSINDVDIGNISIVTEEGKLAGLMINPGETSSIAYLLQTEDVLFCTCDIAAISLCAFMDLENRVISLETAFRNTHKNKKLLIRHSYESLKKALKNGSVLKVQNKLLK
jgi:hypothetical protein